MSPEELVQQACPRINTLGAAVYFAPATVAKGKDAGLDGFRFYVLGRGGPMGDCEASVVRAAFGYFSQSLVDKMWNSAREIMAPRDAGRLFDEAACEFGRASFGELDLAAYCAAAGAINDAADPTALTLYAAIDSEPLADDVPALAMQLTARLREYRGSAHLAALRCVGLSDVAAHAMKRPDDMGMFGHEEAPEIADVMHTQRVEAEALTDSMVMDAFSAVDADGAAALLAGLDAIEAALGG